MCCVGSSTALDLMVPQLAVRKNISAQVTGPLADGIWTGWRESLPAVAVNKTCDGRAVRPTILAAPFWPPLSQRIACALQVSHLVDVTSLLQRTFLLSSASLLSRATTPVRIVSARTYQQ